MYATPLSYHIQSHDERIFDISFKPVIMFETTLHFPFCHLNKYSYIDRMVIHQTNILAA